MVPARNVRKAIAALAVAAGMVVGATASAQVARNLPAEVAAAIDESIAACKPDIAELGPAFTKRKDVNGDGVPDYILDYGEFTCGEMSGYFCGSAGCLMQVFASVDRRFPKVFDENAQDVQFKPVRGRPAMVLSLHGSACGRRGSATCTATLYWNGRSFSRAN